MPICFNNAKNGLSSFYIDNGIPSTLFITEIPQRHLVFTNTEKTVEILTISSLLFVGD